MSTTVHYFANTTYSDVVRVNRTTTGWVRHALEIDLTLVISLYLTVRLAIDLRDMRKERAKEQSNKKYKYLMKVTALLLGISVTLHLADGIFEEVFVDYLIPSMCGLSKCIKAITGSLAFMFSYLVMWLRQRSIYCDPGVRHLTNPVSRALSLFVVFLIVCSPIANTIIYIACFSFKVVESGCAIVGSTIDPNVPWIIIGVTSAVMQIILLGLFLQPLLRHQFNMGSMPRGRNDLKNLIIRAFITATVCTITDTGTSILAASSIFNDGVTIGIAMSISTFINLWMVILSFPNWKLTVLPCCFRKDYKYADSPPATSGSESAGTTHYAVSL